MKFILIYTTHKNIKEAENICNPLLKEKLIACVNYFPITSSYHWKGEIVTASEITAILKTRDVWHNNPLVPHQIVCYQEGTILEVSTPDSVEDNYRILPGDSQK